MLHYAKDYFGWLFALKHIKVNQNTLKQVLFHPLAWVALGLHGLLLVIPFDPSSPAVADEKEPIEEEAIPVDILNLAAIATPTPPPVEPPPAAASPPAAPAAPAQPVPLAAPAPANYPRPVAPAPSQGDVPQGDVPQGDVSQGDVPKGDPPKGDPPVYDPSGDRNTFQANLAGAFSSSDITGSIGLPGANSFRKRNDQLFLPGGAVHPDASDTRWMNNMTPQRVLETLLATYQPLGLQLVSTDTYGDEPLYELKNAEGQIAMYVSLVDLKASTLLVIWPDRPM